MMIKKLNILLIEDDEDDYLIIKKLFSRIRDLHCNIDWVSSYSKALECIGDSDQDIYLIDYRLGDGSGVDLLHQVRENGCDKPIIILTGQGDRDVDVDAMEAGASDYLVKDELNAQTLERSIRYAINIAQTINGLRHARDELSLEVDERKKTELELIKAKKSAENASRIKTEFLSNISHEIRTPMCTIIGMSELLSESELSKKQEVYVKTTMQAGGDLLHLIDEIINISKIESAQVVIDEVPFEFDDLPLKLASIFEKKAQEKGLQFTCHVASDVPKKLIGDPATLEQILTHILSNAVKFTEHGEIALNVCLAEKSGEIKSKKTTDKENREVEECYLRFSVIDTGVGIPKQKQDSIFDCFSQADSSNTREYAGVGLGITISKRLVEMMDGDLWVESEEGKGSKFCLDVRLWKQVDKNENKSVKNVDLAGMNLLIVDDSATYQSIVKNELIKYGASVTQVQSCVEGLNALKSMANNTLDLLIVDYEIPEMDAVNFADKIKEQYVGNNRFPILFLGAYCKYFDGAGVTASSINCIKKPVRTSDLLVAIESSVS